MKSKYPFLKKAYMINQNATITFPFFFVSTTSVASCVNKWKKVAPTKAENMGGSKPSLMGSRPLLRGKKAPPHPARVPQKMGPKRGKENSLGGMASAAARVNFVTTNARKVSYRTVTLACAEKKKQSDLHTRNLNDKVKWFQVSKMYLENG
jgi:hypothetical protein